MVQKTYKKYAKAFKLEALRPAHDFQECLRGERPRRSMERARP